jgi:hypothetical protein
MALSITHSYVSAVPDAGDASLVQPSDWNDTHDISGLAAGIEDFLATPSSANLKTAVTDETGSGALVFGTSPTFTTSIILADLSRITYGGTLGLWADAANGNVFGGSAGNATLTAQECTGFGEGAAGLVTSGGATTGFGYLACGAVTEGLYNAGFGTHACRAVTTGDYNTAVGTDAIYSVTTGNGNTAVGKFAMFLGNGDENTVVGVGGLAASTTGQHNVAIGANALPVLTDGSENVAVGWKAGESLTTGDQNTFVGQYAGKGAVGGDNNVCIGVTSGFGLTSGSNNLLVGSSPTGYAQVSSGSANVSLGYDTAVPTATASDQLVISNFIYGTGMDGRNTTISSGKIGLGVKAPSVQLDVVGAFKLAQGTITDPALNINSTVTWNDAADTFTAWKLDVTSTASAAASLLMDLQVGSASKFNVNKTGLVTLASGTGVIGGGNFVLAGTSANIYFCINSLADNDPANLVSSTAQLTFASRGGIAWTPNVYANTTADSGVSRNAAGIVEINSGTAGTFRDLKARKFCTPMTSELTIASGVVTITGGYHNIDTESDAASDDLDTINGGADGDRLVIRANNAGRTVVVKDATGNIQCAGDFSMDNTQDTMELIYDGTLTAWLEVGRSDSGA